MKVTDMPVEAYTLWTIIDLTGIAYRCIMCNIT